MEYLDRFSLRLFERVRLVPIQPAGYAHAAAFEDLTLLLSAALKALGSEIDICANDPLVNEGVNLVIGAHLLRPDHELPENSIIFNLEQLGAAVATDNPSYLGRLGRHAVLDYSERNAERIRQRTGNLHVQVLTLGYRPELSKITTASAQDVDVLFYGSINPRRQRVLDDLAAAGLRTKALFGVYGTERDEWISRSKLVLNLHFYDDKVHEVVRSSYLLANRKAVVCECEPDTEISADLRSAMACVSYSELVDTCVRLAQDDAARQTLEQRGFDVFAKRDQARLLSEALPKLSRPLPRKINLGSGKDWQPDALNVDIDEKANPDLACDLTAPDIFARVRFSHRFGMIRFDPASFDVIETTDVLEHVPDLVGMMTRCLELLKPGGEMRNSVPYDLSYGAWQDPTHVRAFNERSWLYYTDWHWYLGWGDARFDLSQLQWFLSPLGEEMRSAGTPEEQIRRTPRAIDSIRVVLTKRMLDAQERMQAAAWYARGRKPQNVFDESGERQPMRICLNMIVKNEAHVIERCLKSVRPYIQSWAIADTGSTDGTQDLIRKFLADLPGELIERPWVDFSHNRNEALELARKYGDYALMLDADDAFEADAGLVWSGLDNPGYMFEIVFSESYSWWRTALVRTDLDWRWEGVIHEVLFSSHLDSLQKLTGARIRIIGGGARSLRTPEEKFALDAEVLRNALVDLPDNPRYTFYLAQSLAEGGKLDEAIEFYQRRADLGGWPEEVYIAKFQIAVLKERTEASYPEVVAAYLDAYNFRPQRAEAACELARYLRLKDRYAAAYAFARIACTVGRPEDVLLVDLSVYQWRARDELALAAFLLGNYDATVQILEELLLEPGLPSNERERVRENLNAARGELAAVKEAAATPQSGLHAGIPS